jgi:hypothetical protein
MGTVPLDLQRKCEQRWLARIARPASLAAAHRPKGQDQQLAASAKAKQITDQLKRRARSLYKRPNRTRQRSPALLVLGSSTDQQHAARSERERQAPMGPNPWGDFMKARWRVRELRAIQGVALGI